MDETAIYGDDKVEFGNIPKTHKGYDGAVRAAIIAGFIDKV